MNGKETLASTFMRTNMTYINLNKQKAFVYGDKSFLLEYRFPDGLGFPPSYIDFALNVGWGRLCNLFLIYIPVSDHPDSWIKQTSVLKGNIDTFYTEVDYDPLFLEPDGYEKLPQSAIPFAMSENGEYLIWDSYNRNQDKELPIYVIMSRMGGIRYGSDNLYNFIDNCTNSDLIKKMMGNGYTALPYSFEPMHVEMSL